MRRRRHLLPLVAAVFAVAVLAAPPATSRQGDATHTDVLRFPFPRDDGTLTPYTFEVGYPLVTLVYDTLLWRDEAGVPQPWLAREVETSPDGRQVTVRLADGARWHDDVSLTAADVAFTFRFVSSRFHPRFTPQLAAMERVDAPDPATVVFTLRHASPGFSELALADVPIIPAHLWSRLPKSKLAPDGLPVGSGPYRLVEHRPGEAYRFEANASYFRSPPAVSAIEVSIVRSPEETLRALERSQVDVLALSVPEEAVERLRRGGIRIVEGPSYLGTVLMFNVRRPPFDLIEVRRAVAQALDLGRVTRFVGKAVPADRGYLHPDSRWAPEAKLHIFDPAPARLLAGLPPITVAAVDNDPVKLEAARQVVVLLRSAGLTADVLATPPEELARAIGADGSEPTFQAAISVSPALASYDPDFLYPLFGTDPGRARLNYSGYRSPAFEEAAARVASTRDPAARQAAVEAMLRILAGDAPAVPLFFSVGAFAYRPSAFDGWTFVKGSGIIDKRSFVEPRPPTPPPPPPPPPHSEGRSGLSPVGMAAAGALAMAGILAVVAVVRRRD